MKKWRKHLFFLLFFSLMVMNAGPLQADETSEIILQILIEKGIITQEEVHDMRDKITASRHPQTTTVQDASIEQRVNNIETRLEEESHDQWKISWKDGMRLESSDKRFKIQLGGRIMNDWAFIDEDTGIKASVGAMDNGTEIRRARLYLKGTLYDNVFFKSQYDFVGGDPEIKDMYIGLSDVPVLGRIIVGNVKEPFSLEESTSSKYLSLMERGLVNAFAPGRNIGFLVGRLVFDERMTWALGIFRDTNNFGENGSSGNGEYNLTTRVTAVPWYKDEGARVFHVGGSYSYRKPNDDTTSFDARPESHLAKKFVDTGDITAKDVNLYGVETALVHGPFSLQGEYVYADVDAAMNPAFDGYYILASYFLTGEHRNYERESGEFGRVKPLRNFRGEDKGWGAWELALRYSAIDLSDGGVTGGELADITAGLNWYLNPNTRIMLNYIFADLDSVGEANIVQSRFQVDF